MEQWRSKPSFTILLYSTGSYRTDQLAKSKASVERQIYGNWRVLGPIEGPIVGAELDADFIVPLRVGDELSPAALFRFAETAQELASASIIYGDEDRLDERGRRTTPWFKPKWNEEMFLALDYLSNGVALRSELVRNVAATNGHLSMSRLMLSATAAARNCIQHIPHILYHAQGFQGRLGDRMEAVAEHLRPFGATCSPGEFDTIKVEWPLPSVLPLVTVIVPTRDKLELLRPCVEGVLGRTNYGNFELLIIDNGSVEPQTADFLERLSREPRVRIVSYPEPYNFSAMNNFGVRNAHGSYVCLLNNDTEVVAPAWLTELMRYAVRPEVGAVGAKLLYEDRSIQHAGVVIGIGDVAGHAHRFLPQGKPGYFKLPHVAQFVSAVTAACLVIDKAKLERVGGLDEQLAVAFNDVDFCLKVEAAGWRNVYVPHAVLVHHESKTRGSDMSPDQIDRYYREVEMLQNRWGTKTYVDPLHNPNLDRSNETFLFTV
jgi:GT2 family glycosyltransferase